MNKTFCFIILFLMIALSTSSAENSQSASDTISRRQFDNSICFIKCHQQKAFSLADKSQKQWEILIEKNGHAIFKKIPWENELQKKQIVNYLHENAKGFMKEGIGVWK